MADLSKLQFLSSENYMKREDRSLRYIDIATNGSGDGSGTIAHSFNSVPDFTLGADLLRDGTIWTGTLPHLGQSGTGVAPTVGGLLRAWTTANVLTISISGTANVTYRVWAIIYKDYT